MAAQLQFDLDEGRERKREGVSRVTERGIVWLDEARAIAIRICRERGRVTADDILSEVGKPMDCHHNIIGAVFVGGLFRRIGNTQTKRPEGHARVIGVWVLR